MTIEIHKEKSTGSVRAVTIGATKDQGGTRTEDSDPRGRDGPSLPFL